MENEIKLLQGHCGCLIDENKILYITKQYGICVEFDCKTGNVRALKKDRLKTIARNIMVIDDIIYIITAKGTWIAETNVEDFEYIYYSVKKDTEDYGDLMYVCNYNGVIYLFFKKDYLVVGFNTKTKKIDKFYMDGMKEFKNNNFEFACIYDEKLCMFSSDIKKQVTYSFEEQRVVDVKNLPEISKILYAVYEEGALYLLADKTIYEMKDDWIAITSLEAEETPMKMCITKNKIWLFPGEGENIYVYSYLTKEWNIWDKYPEDFIYTALEKETKYISRCNNEESFCWMMNENNYFVKVDRKNDTIEWVRPHILDKKEFMKNFLGMSSIVQEKHLGLKTYINYLDIANIEKAKSNKKEIYYGIL